MSTYVEVPTVQAASLQTTLDALRGETAMLKASGTLGVSADDLLEGGGTVHAWIGDLESAVAMADGSRVRLPVRDAGMLQHLVYGLSSVLVWAHELRNGGQIRTAIPAEALAAWAEVERVAGLSGRTSTAFGFDTGRLSTELPTVELVPEAERFATVA